MKVTLIVNGKNKIILIPENDFDRAMIKALKSNDLQATEIIQQTQIMDETITEGLMIETKKTLKTES